MYNRLLFLFLLISIKISSAQEFKPYYLKAKAEHGFVMIHTPKLNYLIRDHIQGFEVEWAKQTFGERQWQQQYNYPAWGVAYSYRTLGNDELLGRAHALILNTYFPLKRKNNFQWYFSAGTGPGVIDKKFHHTDNYKNIAIGSHFNVAIKFETSAEIKINESNNLGAALAFTHFSNAAYTSPNLGLNIPTFGLVYKFNFGEKKTAIRDSLPVTEKYFERNIFIVAGVKEIAPPGGNKFLTLTGSFTLARVLNYKSRLGAGVDLIHDPSAGERISRDSLEVKFTDNIKSGLYLSHEWIISDFSMITQAGIYLLAKRNTEGNLYQRIGFRYTWNKKYFTHIALKTHFANADYAEWGLGYRF